MEQEKIIVTGGSGLLGGALKKNIPQAHYPPSWEFDVRDYEQMKEFVKSGSYELLLHGAAFTSPPKIDIEPLKALDTNIIGTANIVKLCMEYGFKLVYISTDYVFKGDSGNYKEEDPVYPVNKYAWSKLGGECAVRLYANALIIRTSFGPDIFPYEKAFVDQWTSRESVSVIARKIVGLLDKNMTGLIHLGGKRRTVYEYAKNLHESKDVKELSVRDVNFSVPRDTSLDCEKYNNVIETKERRRED
jgi:dTDP-4-dehydrorhamnose reductase